MTRSRVWGRPALNADGKPIGWVLEAVVEVDEFGTETEYKLDQRTPQQQRVPSDTSIPSTMQIGEIDAERDFDFAADVPNRLYGVEINHEGDAI